MLSIVCNYFSYILNYKVYLLKLFYKNQEVLDKFDNFDIALVIKSL